jgi:hypothetical protein
MAGVKPFVTVLWLVDHLASNNAVDGWGCCDGLAEKALP